MKNITFKKLSNNGNKQRITLIMLEGDSTYESAVVICVKLLIEKSDLKDYLSTEFKILREYRGKLLIENKMALQIRTLGLINSLVFSEVLEELNNQFTRCC